MRFAPFKKHLLQNFNIIFNTLLEVRKDVLEDLSPLFLESNCRPGCTPYCHL